HGPGPDCSFRVVMKACCLTSRPHLVATASDPCLLGYGMPIDDQG
ncbi:MAG: hypothetical protein QOF66_4641, partial [Mycobacterium sp.]|nr:hypothetical protein [Mycobacterium sp.]